MEIKDIATGVGGGGVLGVILTWLGFKSRLDSIEKNLNDYQSKNTCEAIHCAVNQRLNSIEHKQDRILDILMNGKTHN